MKKIILYRISSQGYPKLKINTINKFDCLRNLLETFQDWTFICVADNCDSELLSKLSSYKFDSFYQTSLGNPGSFWRLYEEGLKIANEEDLIYFVEDDYIHLPEAPKGIEEGLQFFDYVTLYDHPDKYHSVNRALNPYTKINKFSEPTEIHKGEKFLWRTTNSTTMSFAVKGRALIDDSDIWRICSIKQKDHDFDNFCILTKQKVLFKSKILKQLPRKYQFFFKPRRFLGVCLPGLAIHLEKPYILPKDYERFSIPK